MKAAYLKGPENLVIAERPVPKIKENEVLVRVRATAICGTDVSIYKGNPKLPNPIIQGHESTGEIVLLGKQVSRFKIGDSVIINPAYFCGDCYYCKKGMTNLCIYGGLLGRDKDGSFAEFLAVPASNITKLPDNISYEDATSLQALATVLRGWERIESYKKVDQNDVAAVIGLGTPGLLFTRLLALAGATVYATTRSQWKLDIAESYGGIPINSQEDLKRQVLAASEGRGADLVIDAVGASSTFRQAIDVARSGATILSFGIQHSFEGIDPYYFYYKELTILGTRAMNAAGYEKAVQLFKDGVLNLPPLITDFFTLDEIVEYFNKADKEPGKHLRMVCRI